MYTKEIKQEYAEIYLYHYLSFYLFLFHGFNLGSQIRIRSKDPDSKGSILLGWRLSRNRFLLDRSNPDPGQLLPDPQPCLRVYGYIELRHTYIQWWKE